MNKIDFDPTTVTGLNVAAFEQWLGYKRGKKQTYKTEITLRAAATRLSQIGDEQAQQDAIDQAISFGWSGFFAVTPRKLAPGEKPKRTKEQTEAADAYFQAQQEHAARGWDDQLGDPIGRLKLCEALWCRYTVQPSDDLADKMDWLKGVVARNLKEAEAKAVANDPHLMIMVLCFFGPAGVKRIKERAAVGA
jgi:hypothetical protein